MFCIVSQHPTCANSGMEVPLLPSNLRGYEHQVAGHGRLALLDRETGKSPQQEPEQERKLLHSVEEKCVYKPVPTPPKHREVEFYHAVFGDGDEDSCSSCNGDASPRSRQLLSELRRFLPVYLGVFRHPSSGVRYIKLQDLLHGFARPSIMDVKMGAKIYQPNASSQKRSVEAAKYAYREEIGFYVNGMRLWSSGNGFYERYDKSYGKEVTPSNMHAKVMPRLLSAVPANHRLRLLRLICAELEALLAWFESQDLFHFYTSSILLGVESCPEALGRSDRGEARAIHVVRMVDFPYVWPGEGLLDEGYLVGLRTLVRLCRSYEDCLMQCS